MRRPFLFLSAFALALPAIYECATLSPLTPGVCGNGVIDPGEDCDGFVDGAAREACGTPSSGALACRFNCVGTAACPAAFNCGADQICRQPSGKFEPLGTPLAVGGEGVVLADFNGDGYADALTIGTANGQGGARLQVSYLTSAGALLGTYAIADRLTSPTVADVNNDGIADLTATLGFDNSSGIEVFLGQHTTSLAPQPFAAATVPDTIQLRVLPFTGFANGLRRAYFATGGSETYPPGLYLPNYATLPNLSSPATLTIVPLPEGPDMLVGDVQRTQVLASPEPCPALVYAARQPSSVDVVRVVTGVCHVRDDGVIAFSTEPTITTVALPSKRTLCSPAGVCGPGALVGDVNGDGYADLIVTALDPFSNAGVFGTFVAYGDGQGGFRYAPNGSTDTFGPLEITLLARDGSNIVADGAVSPQIPGQTFAVGDVNGDGYADFASQVPEYASGTGAQTGNTVTLLLSHVTPGDSGVSSVDYSTPLGVFTWKSAAFADFNGDGRLDLVGASDTPGFDFYGTAFDSSGNYVPEHFFVATPGAASLLAVGDVDGDGISDLAFEQKDPAGDGTVDVEVAYGASSGPLTPPVSLARYSAITQIVAGGPYTELDVVANATSSTLSVLRFITNSGGRPPLSSVALTTLDAGTSADGGGPSTLQTALASQPGMFVLSDGGTPGLAAVGRNGDGPGGAANLWFIPTQLSKSGISVGVPSVGQPVTGFSPNPSNQALGNGDQAVLLTAGPLGAGGSGPASLVAVSSTPDAGGQTELLIASLSTGSSAPTFGVENLSAGIPSLLPELPLIVDAGPNAPTPVPPTLFENGQVALTDIDGDGYGDLILVTGAAGDVCPNNSGGYVSRNVIVLWNNHQGGFGPAQVVAQCYVNVCDSAGSVVLGCPGSFTTLAATPTGPPTLAYTTLGSVGFAQFGPAASGQQRPVLHPFTLPDAGDAALATSAFAGVPGGLSGISSGDINGDGVPDMAIIARGTLYLFQGVPVNK